MARFTSLEFMEALGLGYYDYNGAKILLRLLQKKGIAKDMGKIKGKGGIGRKVTVYEIPDEFTISVTPPAVMPHHPPKKKKEKTEENVVETPQPEPVLVGAAEAYEFDEGLEED